MAKLKINWNEVIYNRGIRRGIKFVREEIRKETVMHITDPVRNTTDEIIEWQCVKDALKRAEARIKKPKTGIM